MLNFVITLGLMFSEIKPSYLTSFFGVNCCSNLAVLQGLAVCSGPGVPNLFTISYHFFQNN